MLEIACFEITSAEIALQSSADRIEFCDEITLGGITPEIEEFKYLKEKFLKPIYVMIRPKGGGFFYDSAEFSAMIKSIELFKSWNADGFVFGILDENNEVDVERNTFLVELAKPVPCTFHRAFDRTKNLEKSCEKLIKIGFENVLTSGGEKTAKEGVENLKKLIQKAEETLGGIDIFYANAGFAYYEKIQEPSWDRIDKIYKVNVFSPLFTVAYLNEKLKNPFFMESINKNKLKIYES